MHRVWWDVRKGNGAEEVKKKKRKRKAALIREQQLEEEGEGIFCSLAFDGGASKKRDYSWNSRVSYSDFLIAKIMTWPRRFLSPRCIRGRISFEREHEREEGGWGVCFVGEAVETIFRTSGGLVEEDPVSREMSRGSWKNSCEIPTKYMYIWRREEGGGEGWLRDECAHEVEPVMGSRLRRLMLTTRSCTILTVEIMFEGLEQSSILPLLVMSRYQRILISNDRCAREFSVAFLLKKRWKFIGRVKYRYWTRSSNLFVKALTRARAPLNEDRKGFVKDRFIKRDTVRLSDSRRKLLYEVIRKMQVSHPWFVTSS